MDKLYSNVSSLPEDGNCKLPSHFTRYISDKEKLIFTIVVVAERAILLVVNLLTVAAIKKTNEHRETSVKLIMYSSISNLTLAIADGISIIILVNISIANCWILTVILSVALVTTLWQLFMIFIINYDRYYCVRHWHNYERELTRNKIKRIFAVMLFSNIAIMVTQIPPIPSRTSNVILLLTFVIVSVFIICLQVTTAFLLKRHRHNYGEVESCINSRASLIAKGYTFCFIFFHGPMLVNLALTKFNVVTSRQALLSMLSTLGIVSRLAAIFGPVLFIYVSRNIRQNIKALIVSRPVRVYPGKEDSTGSRISQKSQNQDQF